MWKEACREGTCRLMPSVLDASFERRGRGWKACGEGCVSFNAHLSVLDASFENDVDVREAC